MSDHWCTGDCVWMGSELTRLEDKVGELQMRNETLEKMLNKAVKDKLETLKENDKLRERLDQLAEENGNVPRPQ